MSIKDKIQDDMKQAMKDRDQERLECLRMVKGALLLKEKETGGDVSEEDTVRVLRGEVRKRQDTFDLLTSLGKTDEAQAAAREIAVIDAYLPQQLSEDQLEARARAYAADHPEITNAGRLTGALKKELGDQADGRVLAEVCKRALGA